MAAEMLSDLSQNLYHYGVDAISVLQSSFPDSESFFMDVSKVFDPKYVFTVYFPIAFALKWVLGVQLLGTIIVVEWLNQVLKWLMHGDRPYWWVHEVELANNASFHQQTQQHRLPAEIFQFQSTCETGPGMPSGHSMAMSAAWYVITHAVIHNLVQSSSSISWTMKQQTTQLLWAAYALIQGLVIMSRMYIAAHFPHQCFLGLVLGISVARLVYGGHGPASKWINLRRSQWILVASFILASAVGTYTFLLLTGRDPAWSISQAYKWCAKRENIHVDTTPFYSLTRYSGAAFGLGLGLTSKFFQDQAHHKSSSASVVHTAVVMILGLALGQAAEWTHAIIPKTNESVFYSLEFSLNVALPYAVVALSPLVANTILSNKHKSKSC